MTTRRPSARAGLGTLAELNVTPLLDLAFVLLIIFMITAPFLAERADLIIPTSKAAQDAVDPSQIYDIAIDQHGGLQLDGRDVPPEGLAAALLALRQEKPDLAVVIRAHRELPVQAVVGVMDILKDTGVTRVGLLTKPGEPEG
jgi:biopolymer transport protein ExbD